MFPSRGRKLLLEKKWGLGLLVQRYRARAAGGRVHKERWDRFDDSTGEQNEQISER
jgi:hypothetical protein